MCAQLDPATKRISLGMKPEYFPGKSAANSPQYHISLWFTTLALDAVLDSLHRRCGPECGHHPSPGPSQSGELMSAGRSFGSIPVRRLSYRVHGVHGVLCVVLTR